MKEIKLLKENKRGFTLVELVVVIAILAVLAAIAIPGIVGIINSATNAQMMSEASSMDQACKTYYTGIKSGAITSEMFIPEHCNDIIPPKSTSKKAKATMARNCSVAGALEYNDLMSLMGRLEDYAYDKEGNIRVYDENDSNLTQLKPDGSDTFNDLNYAN